MRARIVQEKFVATKSPDYHDVMNTSKMARERFKDPEMRKKYPSLSWKNRGHKSLFVKDN